MRNKLLTTLVAVMCVLAACDDINTVKDFNLEKMSGKWFSVGMASNAQWFVRNRTDVKLGTVTYEPTTEGDLKISYARLKDDGSCWRVAHHANKTETPGRFTFYSQVWKNDNDLRITDVLYDDFALVHTIKTRPNVTFVVNELLSRTPEVSVARQQKFTQLSLDTGILSDNIVILPKNNECPEE